MNRARALNLPKYPSAKDAVKAADYCQKDHYKYLNSFWSLYQDPLKETNLIDLITDNQAD